MEPYSKFINYSPHFTFMYGWYGDNGASLISLLFTSIFIWDLSISSLSQVLFFLSTTESVFKAPIHLNKLISPDILLVQIVTHLYISNTNSMRWEALEYKYLLHILSFLAFRI